MFEYKYITFTSMIMCISTSMLMNTCICMHTSICANMHKTPQLQSSIYFMFHHIMLKISHFIVLTVLTLRQTSCVLSIFKTHVSPIFETWITYFNKLYKFRRQVTYFYYISTYFYYIHILVFNTCHSIFHIRYYYCIQRDGSGSASLPRGMEDM